MTLALTMGMTIGVRKTFYMVYGELLGVALVSVAAVGGVAAIMMKVPQVFFALKILGGGYLVYLGIMMILSKGKMAVVENASARFDIHPGALMMQGFVTAVANPKGWAFMISLLPPFIVPGKPMVPQLFVLVCIILITEFLCLMLYSNGGQSLSRILSRKGNVRILNSISGVMMAGVGVWLALG